MSEKKLKHTTSAEITSNQINMIRGEGATLVIRILEEMQEKGIEMTIYQIEQLVQQALAHGDILTQVPVQYLASQLVGVYTAGQQSNQNNLGKQKGALRELDYLRINPSKVTKERVEAFFTSIFKTLDADVISKKASVGTQPIREYLENNKWLEGMGDLIYHAFEKYIKDNPTHFKEDFN